MGPWRPNSSPRLGWMQIGREILLGHSEEEHPLVYVEIPHAYPQTSVTAPHFNLPTLNLKPTNLCPAPQVAARRSRA